MAKKKREKKPREVTKRQLSRWQQQQRRERITRYSGIFLIVALICFLGAGLYITQYRPVYQTVITVNDTKFNMKYYLNMLKYYGQGQSRMTLFTMAPDVERIIKEIELIRQGALELGITVSNDEVDEKLKSNNPPLSKDYRDIVRASMLTEKLLDEYFEHEVPVFAEQRHFLAIFLESESQALEVTDRLVAGDDFAELAAELSLDSVTKEKKGDLGWHPREIVADMLDSAVAEDYAFTNEVGVLSQPLYEEDKIKSMGYWLIKILERKEDSDEVHIQAILVGSESEANEASARLKAGEDFAQVAGEFSQLENAEENGGDMGPVSPGMLNATLEEFIFDPEVELGTVSELIRDEKAMTTGGYWLVKVLGKEDNRKIEDEDRTLLKSKALEQWISSLWDDPENKIESFLDDEKTAWAIEKVLEG